MDIIIKPRGSGKTQDLIDRAAKEGFYIVCRDIDECSRIAAVAKEQDKNILFPISFDEFLDFHYGRNVNGFLIDQADDYLQYVSRGKIKSITLSKPNSQE